MTKEKQLLRCAALFCALTFLIFALDALCLNLVGLYKPVVRGVVSLRRVSNTGAAFSMLSGHKTLASVLSGALIALLLVFILFGRMRLSARLSLSAVLTGGACNLYMRLVYGSVRDWIELEFMRFPCFNFADICICVGALLFAVFYIFTKENDPHAV